MALTRDYYGLAGENSFQLAYDSRYKHNIGVIPPDLLPANGIIYRYYFSAEPYVSEPSLFAPGAFGPLGGGALTLPGAYGTEIRTGRDEISFIIDFVVTSPVFGRVIEASHENVKTDALGVNYLELDTDVLTVAYVFEAEFDSTTGELSHLIKNDGTSVAVPTDITLPEVPSADDRGGAWFDFFDSFHENPDPLVTAVYADYNLYNGKIRPDGFDYTYKNKWTTKSPANRIEIKNLTVPSDPSTVPSISSSYIAPKKYIITYEGIKQYLFRQTLDVVLIKDNFILGGVNVSQNLAPTIQNKVINHYLWKTWADPTDPTKTLSGWRLVEGWRNILNAYALQDSSLPYDSLTNPRVGVNPVSYVKFNMTEKSLQLPDESRIGYDANFAEYLEIRKVENSNLTPPPKVPTTPLNINDVIETNVLIENFQTESVSSSEMSYLSFGDFVFTTGAIESFGGFILEGAAYTSYMGYWESNFYKIRLPQNTRMVNVYNKATNKINGIMMAVKINQISNYMCFIQDPAIFFTYQNKLYYNFFDDYLGKYLIAAQQNFDEYEANQLTTQVPCPGTVGNDFPGKVAVTEEYWYGTNIDDSNLTSSTSPKDAVATSYADFATDRLYVSSSTLSSSLVPFSFSPISDYSYVSDLDSSRTLYFYGEDVDIDKVYTRLDIKVNFYDSDTKTDVIRVRGWESEPTQMGVHIGRDDNKSIREVATVTIESNEVCQIPLSAWIGVSFIEIVFQKRPETIESLEFKYLDNASEELMLVDGVKSIAAAMNERGYAFCFYEHEEGRVNLLSTCNDGRRFNHVENFFIRGDSIGDLRGIINLEDEVFYLFHFYKDSLLCVPLNINVLRIITDNDSKRATALDMIRRQYCYLVWGNVEKSTLKTEYGSAGEIIFEDIEDNIIDSETAVDNYHDRSDDINTIIKGDGDKVSNIIYGDAGSKNNKFIMVGQKTAMTTSLISSDPDSQEYATYEDNKGILRIIIRIESEFDPVYRMLRSDNGGKDWEDNWNYLKDLSILSEEANIVRINNLSDGVNTEEGTNVFALYSDAADIVVLFYFYKSALLCKFVANHILNSRDLDGVTEYINSLPIYAVAGNFVNIESEMRLGPAVASPAIRVSNASNKILLGTFQKNINNYEKYYTSDIYIPQNITGYETQEGYLRIFIQKNNREIDGYTFDGSQWRPEMAVFENDPV